MKGYVAMLMFERSRIPSEDAVLPPRRHPIRTLNWTGLHRYWSGCARQQSTTGRPAENVREFCYRAPMASAVEE